jgi:CRP-like cAMP-binding protein
VHETAPRREERYAIARAYTGSAGTVILPKRTLRLSLVTPPINGADEDALMDRLAQERSHLALADRHISEAEQRTLALSVLIERRRVAGGDVTSATDLLRLFEETIAVYRHHRDLIVDSIAALERRNRPDIAAIETSGR